MKPQHTPHRFAPNVLVRQHSQRKRRGQCQQATAGGGRCHGATP